MLPIRHLPFLIHRFHATKNPAPNCGPRWTPGGAFQFLSGRRWGEWVERGHENNLVVCSRLFVGSFAWSGFAAGGGGRIGRQPESGHIQQFVATANQNLGHLEAEVQRQTQELQRRAVEAAAQAKADATPPCCPVCHQPLSRLTQGHQRTFRTRFGPVTLRRSRGWCRRCKKWRFPADAALGLKDSAGSSPAVQELAALLASQMPVEEAALGLEHLTGVKLSASTLHREARRQGARAQKVRAELDAQAARASATQLELCLEPYPMILELDAWNIRERDEWGQTARWLRRGEEPQRWHWVWTGTVFRLDQRGQTAGVGR